MKSSELFSDYFLKAYRLNGNEELKKEFIKPEKLLTKERFDLACKIFYIQCREKKQNIELARKLYAEHIKCITYNSFKEPDSSYKNTLTDFFTEFDNLIDSIKTNGFKDTDSIIPVGSNSSILNGAHRVAVCYYFGIDVPIVRINSHEESYDYNFFKEHGMNIEYLDLVAALFVKYCKNAYIGFVWPSVYNHKSASASDILISKTTSVFYKKEISLSFRGMVQLMMQLYGEQEWTGGFNNNFKGVIQKALSCYDNSNTVVYLICNEEIDSIVELKNICRCFFNIGNHSMHFTDTKNEAVMASEIVFNQNSLDLLNKGYIFNNSVFVNFCSKCPDYYSFCSVSSDISRAFFANNYHFQNFNDPLKCIKDSKYSAWFESTYCFGKRMDFKSEYITKTQSPYELIWKKEKRRRQIISFKKTIFYKTARLPFRLFLISLFRLRKTIVGIFRGPKKILNIEKAFRKLNKRNCNYLIMRNYENFFDDLLVAGHGDVDVLVESNIDRSVFLSTFKAIPRWGSDDGHAYKFLWRDKWIELDIRMVGDNYYDLNWESNMLKNKIIVSKGFFVMCETDYKYSLVYHAFYQKKQLSADYIDKFIKWFGKDTAQNSIKENLRKFMIDNNYLYCYPNDNSVICYFDRHCSGLVSNSRYE